MLRWEEHPLGSSSDAYLEGAWVAHVFKQRAGRREDETFLYDWLMHFGRKRGEEQSLEAAKSAAESAFRAWCERAAVGGLIQPEVNAWAVKCFGTEAFNPQERAHRFLEEALELAQACGVTDSEVSVLTGYVYGRPIGEKKQEAAGTLLTLAALCTANGIDMQEAGETELQRLSDPAVTTRIRAKHLSKPRNSPLPGTAPRRASSPIETISEQSPCV